RIEIALHQKAARGAVDQFAAARGLQEQIIFLNDPVALDVGADGCYFNFPEHREIVSPVREVFGWRRGRRFPEPSATGPERPERTRAPDESPGGFQRRWRPTNPR